MNTIRVAMIIQAYHPHVGGAERQLAAISPRLQRQGVDVHVLTRQQPGLPRYELINGIPVHRIPTPGNHALASLSFTTLALPLLTWLRPNLIHAHEMLSPTTTAVFAKRILKVPIITKVLRGGDLGDIAYLQSHKTGRQRLATFRQDVDRFIAISQEIDRELESMGVAHQQTGSHSQRSQHPALCPGINGRKAGPAAQTGVAQWPHRRFYRPALAGKAGGAFAGYLAAAA